MIDLTRENVFPLAEVPDHIPTRKGKRVDPATVYRWVKYGCRGKRLEAIRIGGCIHTSTQAIQRFADALTDDPHPSVAADPPQPSPSALRADQALTALGI